ncbi:histidine phosphatase family protein, partial [Paenibacillus sp. TAF58]
LASAELASTPSTRFDDRVYAASADRLLAVVRETPDSVHTLLMVGHNPGMEQLASRLADEDVVMRTSGIAEISVEGPWSELDAASAALLVAGRSNGHDLG